VNAPVQNNFGETGPDVFRGPGYFDIDTRLTKKFYIQEKYAFEFGAQAFNTLNHPNFSVPSASLTAGTSLAQPRVPFPHPPVPTARVRAH
jgi:hypothetical protein